MDKNNTDLRNKRDKKLVPIMPELSDLHKSIKRKCILDGELIVTVDGKPDFYAMMKRSLMTNSFKINLAASQHPVSFVAYDILYLDDKLIIDLPLLERKEILKNTVTEIDRLVISRYVENEGIKLFQLTKERQLEGIVAKPKDSQYRLGKKTDIWIKCKHEDYSRNSDD